MCLARAAPEEELRAPSCPLTWPGWPVGPWDVAVLGNACIRPSLGAFRLAVMEQVR